MLDRRGEIFLVFIVGSLVGFTLCLHLRVMRGRSGGFWRAGPSGFCLYEHLLVENIFQGKKESGTAVQLEGRKRDIRAE